VDRSQAGALRAARIRSRRSGENDAPPRDRRRRRDPRLLARLHAGRPGQIALLRVALVLHVLYARDRRREQLRDDVHLLGTRGREQLFADRPLVRARQSGRSGEESVSDKSDRRFRIHARYSDGLGRDWFGCFQRDESTTGADHQLSRLSGNRSAVDFLRRHRQIRAVPAPRLVARRHGRSDADLGADPRRHDGGSGRLHAGSRGFSPGSAQSPP